MKAGRFALFVGFAMLASVSYAAPRIDHTPLTCVAPNVNARITARVPGQSRVLFSLLGDKRCSYYVNMRNEDGFAWTMLPQLSAGGAGISYRIISIVDGKEVSSPDYDVTASADCAMPPIDAAQAKAANQITVGMTEESATEAPCGFNCNGIVGVITTAGVLKPNEMCTRLLAASGIPGGAGATVAATSAGMTPALATKILAGSLLAIGGTVSVVNSNNDNPPPTSNSRP